MIFYVTFGPAHLPNPDLPGVTYGDVLVVRAGQASLAGRAVKRLLGPQYGAWSDVLTEKDRAGCGDRWGEWFPGREWRFEKFEPVTTWRRERRAA